MYKTEVIEIKFGHTVLKLHQVTNVDEVFDQLLLSNPESIEVKDERIPYWTELWPAAIAMGQFIMEHAEFFRDKKVLEIACGLGLPSIVAGKWATSVTLSDYLPEAVKFASANWSENNHLPAQFEILDWREPLQIHPWPDIILASDIAYEKRFQDLLPSKIEEWCRNGSIVVFSEPGRVTARDFMKQLNQSPLLVKSETIKVEWRDLPTNVNLCLFSENPGVILPLHE